jgi:hypothetical protein
MGMKVFASGMNYGTITLDAGDIAQDFSALYVGVTGDVGIKSEVGGTSVVFSNVVGGTILPVKGKEIDDGDTTASQLVWLDW